MGDYSTNYLKGFFSALIISGMISIMYYVMMPVWASFSYGLEQSTDLLRTAYPLSGFSSFMNNLSASLNVGFFFLIIFPIIYLLILPFMREPQESPDGMVGRY